FMLPRPPLSPLFPYTTLFRSGLVFQSYALFPHLTVADNVAFGLRMRKLPQPRIAAKLTEVLRLVRLEGLANRLPRELSGGQQQRDRKSTRLNSSHLVISYAVF